MMSIVLLANHSAALKQKPPPEGRKVKCSVLATGCKYDKPISRRLLYMLRGFICVNRVARTALLDLATAARSRWPSKLVCKDLQ